MDSAVLLKIFTTLWVGRLVCKQAGGSYTYWRNTGYPLAMALSHGGRVMIQLPADAAGDTYWNWLWGGPNAAAPFARKVATHSIELRKHPKALTGNVQLYMNEENPRFGAWSGQHFGINIALGGLGNYNPFSGQRVHPAGRDRSQPHFGIAIYLLKSNFQESFLFLHKLGIRSFTQIASFCSIMQRAMKQEKNAVRRSEMEYCLLSSTRKP